MRLIFLLIGMFLLPFFTLKAQLEVYTPEPGDLVKVVMVNGERYVGEYVEEGIVYLVLLTTVAEIKLNAEEVQSIVRAKYKGSRSDPHPHSTRYFIGPTATPLKSKEAFFQTSYGLLNSIEYGVTNHFSIRGGFELITLISGESFYFLNPRVGFRLTEDSHFGGGLLLVKFPGVELAGYYYGSFTFGGQDANVTFGVGDTLFKGRVQDQLLYNISAMKRIGKRFLIVSENYLIPQPFNDTVLLGFQGIRYFKGKNAFEFSAAIAYEIRFDYLAPPIPYLGYSRKF